VARLAIPLGIPLADKQAECVAELYLEAGLSDAAIDALSKGKPLALKGDDVEKASEVSEQMTEKCL
jgi:hypothetical protein